MFIKRLKLVNFGSHSATDIVIGKHINFFQGGNNTGKSTIVDALAFLFTGTNPRTELSGAGMNELITFGESHSLVSAEIEGIGKVTRTIPHTFQVADWEGTITLQETRLFDLLKTTPSKFLCGLYSMKFLELSPSAQKDMLFELLNFNLSNETIVSETGEWLKSSPDFDSPSLRKTVEEIVDLNGSELDNIQEDIKDRRRLIKKELKPLESIVNAFASKLPDGVKIEDKENIVKKLTALKENRDKILISVTKNKESLQNKKELELKIAREKELISPEESQVILKEKIEDLREKHIPKVVNGIATNQARLNTVDKDMKGLKKFNGKCPLSESLDCALGAQDVKKIVAKLEAEKAELKETIAKLEASKLSMETDLSGLHTKLEQRLKFDIIAPEIKTAKDKLIAMTDITIENLYSMEKELTTINERITKGQLLLSLIEAESYNYKTHVENKRKMERSQQDLKNYEILAEMFGPGGVKAAILSKVLKPVKDKLNSRLATLTDGKYTVNFEIGDSFSINITSGGMERSVKHLSSSEKLRLGIVFQDVINNLAKNRLLVVDNVEILDIFNKKLFWKLINDVKNNYNTILILQTSLQKNEPKDDVDFFNLKQ